MVNEEEDEVIKELFDLLENRYKNNLEYKAVSLFIYCIINILK